MTPEERKAAREACAIGEFHAIHDHPDVTAELIQALDALDDRDAVLRELWALASTEDIRPWFDDAHPQNKILADKIRALLGEEKP